MNILNPRIIWKFSRPHTIIGSGLSIVSIFLLVIFSIEKHGEIVEKIIPHDFSEKRIGFMPNLIHSLEFYLNILIPTVIACLLCNIFITGLNQITDIEIDKINKPKLPIITGELTPIEAKIIVIIAIIGSLYIAYFHYIFLFYLIAIIGVIGAIYSLPPIRLKQRYSWASLAIALVRGPLINIGIAIHFIGIFNQTISFITFPWLLPLTVFITCFSIGIAWFKDIPDTDGDKQFNVKTLAATFSKNKALKMGTNLIIGTYVFMGVVWFFIPNLNPYSALWLFIIHFILLFLFYTKSKNTNLDSQESIKKFYKFYWILFFLEYLLLPVIFRFA
jgi:homogentisate phytyltransferase/homogentisate geranylgeranyltransferase